MIWFLSCHKYVRGKRGKRGKSSFLPFYPSHALKEKGELQKNVIVVFDPDYQCFVAVAELFFGARLAAAYLRAFRGCLRAEIYEFSPEGTAENSPGR
jgi:hypothetical protein